MTRDCVLALLIALGMSAAAGAARAEQSEQLRPLFVRLSPTAGELSREHSAALERRLAELLSTWPGVHHAEVHLTLPVAAAQPLDRPLPPPRATVVLARSVGAGGSVRERRADQPSPAIVLTLLRSALPTLEPHNLTLLDQVAPVASPPSPAQTPAARNASAITLSQLRAGLAASLVVNALLAATVLWRLRRHRPAAQKVDPHARSPFPP